MNTLYSYWIYLSGYLFNVFPATRLGTRTTFIHPTFRMLSCVTAVGSLQCFACSYVLQRFAPTLYVFVWVYFVFGIYLGKNLDRFDSVEGVEVRRVPEIQGSQFLHSSGTIDGGGELMRVAWPQMKHVFVGRRKGDSVLPVNSTASTPEGVTPPPSSSVSSPDPVIHLGLRLPKNLLYKHPVDLLVIGRSSDLKDPPVDHVFPWERTITQTKTDHRPKVILECWDPKAINWDNVATTKGCFARWSQQGYDSSLKHLHGLEVGSNTNHHRLMVVRVQKDLVSQWKWPESPLKTPHRSMSNLLTPPGTRPASLVREEPNYYELLCHI